MTRYYYAVKYLYSGYDEVSIRRFIAREDRDEWVDSGPSMNEVGYRESVTRATICRILLAKGCWENAGSVGEPAPQGEVLR